MRKLPAKTKFFNALRLVFRNRLAEAVLFPLTNGRSWNSFFGKLPANFYQYPKNSWRKVKRNGFEFRLDISDYMQWLIYFGLKAEPREVLYKLIRPGMTILDIGANIGETTLAFSRLTGKNGKVISFEPDPVTFLRLQEHLELNNCKNVIAINKGLGNSESEMILEKGENNSGGNRISPLQTSGEQISITTLDKIYHGLNITSLDFIKIDVEGYELHVLEGGKETIGKFKPEFFIELVDDFLRDQGNSSSALVKFLEERNYAVTSAENGEKISSRTDFSKTHFDIIAIPA
jgi:FkbM family methyltransferase